ncbi:TadE/TadG family type IV pilus assembly protein [Frankia sp. KB5]|uniref:TadE/TadG family type IV pilus assembly protein n=1 Tax=Frankia sp. KB5 TaxID=683318 RepID=UPI000A1139D1|nr:TadE/TadG family type IV pilus assembly protein [Frankia sp. KB5]ORT55689.1 pilus assembly protein TadE [Frankia sp. KB5]
MAAELAAAAGPDGIDGGPRGTGHRPDAVEDGVEDASDASDASDAADAADGGSAVVEFILVGTLLLFLILGIIQVGLVLHIRNTLAADAAEGARHATNLGVPASEGGPYAQALIARTIPGRSDAVCTGAQVDGPGGTPLAEVTCRVAVPLVLVPLGDGITITVKGHALKELP